MQKVKQFIVDGWLKTCEDTDLFFVLGYRIIVPAMLQAATINFLHISHMDIIKMKAISGECCWWSNQSKDLEDVVEKYDSCLLSRPIPPKQELIPWKRSDEIWSRIYRLYWPFLNRNRTKELKNTK